MRFSISVLVAAFLSATLLTACGGNNVLSSSTPLSVAPSLAVSGSGSPQTVRSVGLGQRTSPRKNSATFTIVYNFAGGNWKPSGCEVCDGNGPYAGLTDVNGTFYGTTLLGGGQGGYACNTYGCGTVFSVTTSGIETVLHDFASGDDGAEPAAGLLEFHGKLYGTTTAGGAYGDGTVFSITPSGKKYTVLHSFGATAGDGSDPNAELINVKGALYGTTTQGGANNGGTVFEISPSGTERLVHSFGGSGDPGFPSAALIEYQGMLYGTTRGTVGYCYGPSGAVFAISKSGTETVLHSFGYNSGDGDCPSSALTVLNGKLYGTTAFGGAYNGCSHGCGTVFTITRSGKEKVIHSFGAGCPSACTDGTQPQAALINVNGTLYGTTYNGGVYSINWGTIFSISSSGAEAVLHNFGQNEDLGGYPYAGLINVDGALWGTTLDGGDEQCNCGTVFSLSGFQ